MSYKTHYFNCSIIYNWNQMPLKFLSSVIFVQKKSIVFIFLSCHFLWNNVSFHSVYSSSKKVQSARDRTLNESVKHKQEKGHFWVVPSSVSKQVFVPKFHWKWVWLPWKWKCRWRMVLHQDLFSHKGKEQLGNGLLQFCMLKHSHLYPHVSSTFKKWRVMLWQRFNNFKDISNFTWHSSLNFDIKIQKKKKTSFRIK